jgi:hypothetical protein
MAGKKQFIGPGRIEGHWTLLRKSPNYKVSFRVDVYVDNGYGNHGYIPIHGMEVFDTPATEDLVCEAIDYRVDDIITSGEICAYMPGYLCVDAESIEECCEYCREELAMYA